VRLELDPGETTGTADTQIMRAAPRTIPAPPPSDRPSHVEIENDHAERTPKERAELEDRRWRILADQYAELAAANAALARRAQRRDHWEVAMADLAARQNNALTVLLARGKDLSSEQLKDQVVLVVEDDPHLLPVMRMILSEAGATVYYERAALDARLRLERIGPANLSCAVIDVRLREGDGLALAHDLRRRASGCGVVLTSGYPLDEHEGAADLNRFTLLDKPFEPAALIDSVLAAIALQGAA
jgi:CheY-like chemotaxis protein